MCVKKDLGVGGIQLEEKWRASDGPARGIFTLNRAFEPIAQL